MKKTILFIITASILAIGLLGACSKKEETTPGNTSSNAISEVQLYGAAAANNDKSLTMEEMLIYAIEDEYGARKEYEIIMDKYGEIKPFSNIIKAEEQHISELSILFEQYNIPIPKDNSNEYTAVPNTLEETYSAGVTAEINNIEMYERFLKEDIPEDIKVIFTILRDASKNHLEAFQRKVN